MVWIGFIWLRIKFSGGLFEHGNKPLGFIQGREYLYHLNDCQLLKKGSVPWN
jgi:hypothetical protein